MIRRSSLIALICGLFLLAGCAATTSSPAPAASTSPAAQSQSLQDGAEKVQAVATAVQQGVQIAQAATAGTPVSAYLGIASIALTGLVTVLGAWAHKTTTAAASQAVGQAIAAVSTAKAAASPPAK